MRLRLKCISAFILVLVFFSAFAVVPARADWVTGTRKVTVWITQGSGFAGGGKYFKVRLGELKDAKKVVLHIEGHSHNDPYARFLTVKIDGQIVNPITKPNTPGHPDPITPVANPEVPSESTSFPGFYPWVPYSLITCTAEVQKEFYLQYDVTQLVKGKDEATVYIYISNPSKYGWFITAWLAGIVEEKIYIPPQTDQSEEPTQTDEIKVTQPHLAIPLPQFSAGLGIANLCLAGYFKKHEEKE